MNAKFWLLVCCVFASSILMAQTPPEISINETLFECENGTIEGDPRIKKLEETYIQVNEKDPKMNGYRIQLFSSRGPESFNQANEVQTEFLKIYPDIAAYVLHISASFKLRVGDYRNRMEAERFYVELRENFPDAFIVRDRINFPELSIEQEKEENEAGDE